MKNCAALCCSRAASFSSLGSRKRKEGSGARGDFGGLKRHPGPQLAQGVSQSATEPVARSPIILLKREGLSSLPPSEMTAMS